MIDTTQDAKALLRSELQRLGISVEKLTARTISFQDLARGQTVFVQVQGMKLEDARAHWETLRRFARAHNFRVELT